MALDDRHMVRLRLAEALAAQAKIQRINPLWWELLDPAVPHTAEEADSRMKTLHQLAWTRQCPTALKVAPFRRNNLPFKTTVLSAALLCERFDVFRYFFHTFFRRERRLLRQNKPTLWNWCDHLSMLRPVWKELKHGTKTNHKIEVLMAYIFALLHKLPSYRALSQHMIDHVAAILSPRPGAFDHFYERCQVHMTRILDQDDESKATEATAEDGEIISSPGLHSPPTHKKKKKKTKKRPLFLPPWPSLLSLSHWVSQWPASRINESADDPVQRARQQRMYTQFILQPEHDEFQRWARTHWWSFLAFMDHRIRPYMTAEVSAAQAALQPRRRGGVTTPERPLLRGGYALCVPTALCTYEVFDAAAQYGVLRFKTYQFVMRHSEYEHAIAQPTTTHWLLLCHGATCTDTTHPWIRQQLVRYGGRVSRLRFGAQRSDGLVLNWQHVKQLCPELLSGWGAVDDSMLGGVYDLTAALGLAKSRRKRARRRRRPQAAIPFEDACVLTATQLRCLAPVWAQWSLPQRYCSYLLFWNVNAVPFAAHAALNRNWASMLNTALHWTADTTLAELRSWLTIGMPDSSIRRQRQALFWQRWQHLLTQLTAPARTVQLFQQELSPLLSLLTLVGTERVRPNDTSTLLGHVCRFTHQARVVWAPLQLPPLPMRSAVTEAVHCLVRILLAPDFPAEVRRLAWHSLPLLPLSHAGTLRPGHADFPPNTYPLLTAAETAAMPRLFVQLQNPAFVSDQTILLTFARESALSTRHETLLQLREDIAENWEAAQHVTFTFEHEEGLGPSVTGEVLQRLWSVALSSGVLEVLDEDATVCLTPHQPTALQRLRLFELGLVSALCVVRGLYLPYPLHVGWWRHLTTRPHEAGARGTHGSRKRNRKAEQEVASSDFFVERTQPKLSMIEGLSPTQRREHFLDLVTHDPDAMTDEELVQACFLPQTDALEAFRQGWEVCMRRVDLTTTLHHLNAMFCETTRTRITAPRLAELLTVTRHANDASFVRALHRLSEAELLRLVHFITGKPRLPVPEMDEELIRIHWEDVPGGLQLPRAQNCTHTLLMPYLETPVTPDTVLQVLRPILEFDTVYGFL